METKTLLQNEECLALLDQLSVAFIVTYNPALSCPTPFSLLIDSECRNRIDRWIETQDHKLLQAVFSGLLQQFTANSEKVHVNLIDKRLSKISEYVHRNYSRDINSRALALHIGMTKPAFCRFFKKATGETFTGYLKKIRVEYAVRQLRESNNTVEVIGYSCGFNTPDYFIRIFKKVKGCTPGKFREGRNKWITKED